MAQPPRSMAMAMSMALPTPPNSGKDQVMHSFSPRQYSDYDMPLFGPLVDTGRRSPSDVAMMRGQTAHDEPSHASARWSPKQSPAASAPLFGPITQDAAYQYISPHQRKSTTNEHRPKSNPIPQPAPPLSQSAEPRRTKSSFSPEEIDLLVDFSDRFPRTFEVEAPFLRIRTDPKGKSWLDLPSDMRLSMKHVPTEQDPSLPRGHKRKDSGLGDLSPRKKLATVSKPRQRHATPKVRAGTPKDAHSILHSRKRSTLSETHSVKGDNRPTRQAANKPKVSTDYRDWPDFTPPPRTLDNDHARSVAAKFDIGLIPKTQDFKHDPLLNELHEVELEIIRKACIDPSKYLFAKRSVFVGYLKHLLYEDNKRALTPREVGDGLKSWNKTAAQISGHIDVNKTSRLFQHFWSQVGWFDREHFEHFLTDPEHVVFPEFDHADGHLLIEGGFRV